MIIALPHEHSLGYCPAPRGWFRLSFGPCWARLQSLSALGEALKGPRGILRPSLASHSGSGHLGGCSNRPLQVQTDPHSTAGCLFLNAKQANSDALSSFVINIKFFKLEEEIFDLIDVKVSLILRQKIYQTESASSFSSNTYEDVIKNIWSSTGFKIW